MERIGGITQYDITDPNEISFVNYINSRDFSAPIKDDVSPEGLYFIGAEESPTGMPMLLAACEVSGTAAAYSLSRGCTVTFVADGKVVGQTEVAYGGTLAELPDIPAKVGYEATPPVWDTEEFSEITDDLIVTAVYVKDPTPDEKPDGDVSNGDGTNVNLPGGDKKDPDSEIAANAPETGDFSNWVLWVGVLILVVGLLDALLILRQKRRDI